MSTARLGLFRDASCLPRAALPDEQVRYGSTCGAGGCGHRALDFSPNCDVTATVATAVVAEGCNSGDVVGFACGRIAVVQRGNREVFWQGANVEAAGAAGMLVYNLDDERWTTRR